VRLVQDPRPGTSKRPAGLVDFFSPTSCAHALAASAGVDVRVGGSVVQPEAAKASAMAIPDTWPARLASAVSRLGPTAASLSSSRLSSSSSGSGSRSGNGSRDPRASSSSEQAASEEAAALLRARHLKKATPLWPPPFEADGAAWVFDPASTYFCHRATGMFYEPKAKWYGKQDPSSGGAYVYYRHAPGKDPPFERMDTAVATPADITTTAQATAAGASAAAAVTSAPVPVQQSMPHAQAAAKVAPTGVAPATAAAAAAAEGAAAVAAAEALARREAAKASKAAMSSTARKNLSVMNSWKERAQKEAAEDPNSTAAPSSTTAASPSAAAAPAAVTSWKALSAPESNRASSPGNGDGTSAAALLMTLGTDFATVHLLGLKPENDATPSGGANGGVLGPLIESNGSKWACLVSRRAFATEEQLAKHIRLSQLYHDELAKSVTQGRVVLRPKGFLTEKST